MRNNKRCAAYYTLEKDQPGGISAGLEFIACPGALPEKNVTAQATNASDLYGSSFYIGRFSHHFLRHRQQISVPKAQSEFWAIVLCGVFLRVTISPVRLQAEKELFNEHEKHPISIFTWGFSVPSSLYNRSSPPPPAANRYFRGDRGWARGKPPPGP